MFIFHSAAKQTQLSKIARPYLWTLPVVAGLGMGSGLLEGAGIGLLIPLLGTLLGTDEGPTGGMVGLLNRFAHGLDLHERLFAVAGAMLGLVLLKNLLQVASHVLVAHVDGRASDDIRRALANRLLTTSYSFHLQHDPARLVNIVATESWHASEAIRAEFSRLECASIASVFLLMLFFLNWKLTLIVIGGVLVLRVVQSVLLGPVRAGGERVTRTNSELYERMLASVYRTRVIRLFRREADEQRQFDATSDDVRDAIFVVARKSALVWPTLEVLRAALFLAILLISAFNGVSFPELAALLVVLNRLQPQLRTVEDMTTALASVNARVAEVEWLLGARVPTPAMQVRPFRKLDSGIEFCNVRYAYPMRDDLPALHDVSFTLRAGRATALIGPSGSGKSTIINLLCRLVEPTHGVIRADGEAIRDLSISTWLASIGVAGQDVDLITGTVEENIRFGRVDLTAHDIEAAARQADAHAFVLALPLGYATRLGEGGHGLSGGQRQRIGVARALARHPSILILDEATNSVDAASEAGIFRTLMTVANRPTMLVVSHRMSTLALCDDGIVIENGRVIEQGSLESMRAYRKLLAFG